MSHVRDIGPYKSRCGYCKSSGQTRAYYGLDAFTLTVHDYQDLLDKGWRRAGKHIYKPQLHTCCPHYSIRLRASDFVPSKDQKRVLRRMQRYLDGEQLDAPEEAAPIDGQSVGSCKDMSLDFPESPGVGAQEETRKALSRMIRTSVLEWAKANDIKFDLQIPENIISPASSMLKRQLSNQLRELVYVTAVAFPIIATLLKNNVLTLSPIAFAESIASILNLHAASQGFDIQASKGYINFYREVSQAKAFQKGRKMIKMQEAKSSSCIVDNHHRKRCLKILMEKSAFDPEEFHLYQKYQIAVHNDRPEDVTEERYKRFLVSTPLVDIAPTGDNTAPPSGFGSFHQQYRIDGQLVAVGVIDVLPNCLSSKYLFWDPDLAFLSLGKYTALMEIKWVKTASSRCPSLDYYYMGYYIHSCSKMNYKAAYAPSELLCPFRYQWVPLDIARPMLESDLSVCLTDIEPLKLNVMRKNKNYFYDKKLLEVVPVFLRGERLSFKMLAERNILRKEFLEVLEKQILNYIEAVGDQLASRLVYWPSFTKSNPH